MNKEVKERSSLWIKQTSDKLEEETSNVVTKDLTKWSHSVTM